MYTIQEYAEMSSKANEMGQVLYTIIHNTEGNIDKTLVIAPEKYYICNPNSNETYGEINPEYEREILAEAKEYKYNEILNKAKRFIDEGFVSYKDLNYETNTQTTADLTTALTILKEGEMDSYPWVSKDDVPTLLTLDDVKYILYLIADRRGIVWNVQYMEYKNQVDSATTKDEVNAIVVDYNAVDLEITESEE